MNIVITGTKGFIGKNLRVAVERLPDVKVLPIDVDVNPELRKEYLFQADVVFHLAGVNRPGRVEEFEEVNTGLTHQICSYLEKIGHRPLIVLASSIQADLDNPYGRSKKLAEEVLAEFAFRVGAVVRIFRLQGVFGKWCRPNYNSVVATFCHNIAHDLPITISDPSNEVSLVYIDDVVEAFLKEALEVKNQKLRPERFDEVKSLRLKVDSRRTEGGEQRAGNTEQKSNGREELYCGVEPVFRVRLGELADKIRLFRDTRVSLRLPAFDDPFICRLYATYLSYLDGADFAYGLDRKSDNRGSLAEFLKSPSFGQIFLSRTKPGITRGNHYHNTKTEKFLVIQGAAVIRFRHILGREVIEYHVKGEEFRVVDIPPGYTHSIENVGEGELVTLFWANEIFDPAKPDTFFEPV